MVKYLHPSIFKPLAQNVDVSMRNLHSTYLQQHLRMGWSKVKFQRWL